MPKAYLTVLFFDERMQLVGESSSSQRVSISGSVQTIALPDIQAPKNGYAYLYVSNESVEPVYFDNFRVQQRHSNIVEENHYYAYGLKIAAISSNKLNSGLEGVLGTAYLYNDKELWEDADLNWYDYGFRNYDPQTGRFTQLDPLTFEYPELTNYQYASCEPIANMDRDGLEGQAVTHMLPEVVVTAKNLSTFSTEVLAQEFSRLLNVALPAINNAILYTTINGSAQFLNTANLGSSTVVGDETYYTQKELDEMLHRQPNAIHQTSIEDLRERFWMGRAAAYASLDHLHGQVDFPINSMYPRVYGSDGASDVDAVIAGVAFTSNHVIDDNGYITGKRVPAKPIIFEFDAPIGNNPEAALMTLKAAKGGVTALEEGGLNLFKFGSKEATSSTGWKSGDRFLKMFDQGSPKLNWKQNSGFLRREMGAGNPIFDSYRLPNGNLIPTGGFLNAERSLLQSRGWIYNPGRGAWLPPGF